MRTTGNTTVYHSLAADVYESYNVEYSKNNESCYTRQSRRWVKLLLQPSQLLINLRAGNPGEVWHPLIVEEKEIPKLKDGQVLVKLHAAALNYREIWIRRCELGDCRVSRS